MTREEHAKIIADLQAVVPVEQHKLLLNLTDDYAQVQTDIAKNSETVASLTKQTELYREENSRLWKQIPALQDNNQNTDNLNTQHEDEKPKLTYEELLKGEI